MVFSDALLPNKLINWRTTKASTSNTDAINKIVCSEFATEIF